MKTAGTSAADAAKTPSRNGRGAPLTRVRSKRDRRRPVDGRFRSARRWKSAFEDAMRRAGNRSEQLAKAYASAVCMREQLDAAIARGEMIDPLLLCRLSGEARRLAARLDLADETPAHADAPAWVIRPAQEATAR